MSRRIFFLIGAAGGFLFAKILNRKNMERLARLDQKETEHKAYYADLDRRWQEELASMPFDKRMEWELFDASLRLDNYQPDWDDDEDDDDYDDYDDYDD
jgi:hypothetical protein